MALTNTDRKVIHAGNGSATVFPYGFPILEDAHLSVMVTDAGGGETTLSPSLYSVAGIGSLAGGAVTYPKSGAALTVGTKLTIVRTVPYTQTTVLSNQGGYYPEVVEARLDQIYMAMQQLAEIVGRYTVSSISDPATEQSNYGLIQTLQATVGGFDKLSNQGDLLTRDGSGYKRLARGTVDQVLSISGADLIWRTLAAYPVFSGLCRQTVAAGPVTTAGLPNFLPSANAALSVTSTGVSSTYPLVATAAAGWSATTGGPVDVIGYSTANLTWTGLTANRAVATPNFLYVTIANGLMTPGSTILAPVYQWGGTPVVTSGQFTFNIAEMRGYLGNGTTAPQVSLVMVGEAATDGTGVISTVAYAYNGRYDSGFTSTLPGTSTSIIKNHNLGCLPQVSDMMLQCSTADNGFVVGEQFSVRGSMGSQTGSARPPNPSATRNTIRFVTTTSSAFLVVNPTTFVANELTSASWKYKFIAERGW